MTLLNKYDGVAIYYSMNKLDEFEEEDYTLVTSPPPNVRKIFNSHCWQPVQFSWSKFPAYYICPCGAEARKSQLSWGLFLQGTKNPQCSLTPEDHLCYELMT